jgi:signal transduction histidine kinase
MTGAMGPTRGRDILNRLASPLRSVRGQLALLVVATILPAAVMTGLLVRDLHQQELIAKQRQLLETSRALTLATDASLGQGKIMLDALAASDSLLEGDLPRFEQKARRLTPDGWAVMLVGADGRQLMNTRLRGVRFPLPATQVGKAVFDRTRPGPPVISNVFIGTQARRPTIALDSRVDLRDGYLLSLLVEPKVFADLLAKQNLPDGWVAALIDREGAVIARSRHHERFAGAPATPDVRAMIARKGEGVIESRSLEGVRSVAALTRSDVSGWTVLVAVSNNELEKTAVRGQWLALAASAFTLGLGLALGGWLSSRIVRAVELLRTQAEVAARGEVMPPQDTGLAEIDRVSDELARSASALSIREQELERRVQEAVENLAQAQKLEAVGQLTGGVAHDFNNLLTGVLGNLYLLKRTALDEKQSRFVANAEAAGQRGAKLTSQLLAFSRRQRLSVEPVDVNALLADMSELLRSTLGSTIRVNLTLDPQGPTALCDRTQLELAVLNLCINGRDAMPKGGSLTVSTDTCSVVDGETSPAWPAGLRPGRYAVIRVTDEGAGMPPEVAARAFEPFFTTKAVGRGSGLGLPQVLGVARQLGGEVQLTTAEGAGTTVSIYLPEATAAAAASDQGPPADAFAPGECMVLVIDDDDQVRETTTTLLTELGCEVIEAASGEEGLRLLETGGVGAVVLDYAMPDMNGADVARRMRERDPDLPILMVTGYAEPEALQSSWDGPVVSKPFSAEALATALKEVLAQRRR